MVFKYNAVHGNSAVRTTRETVSVAGVSKDVAGAGDVDAQDMLKRLLGAH
jgi:hypothetical protein